MAKAFRVTLRRSLVRADDGQKQAVRCLGLRRRHQTVEVADNPANRGQILKVQHLLTVEPIK